jgi:hypothetical protein
MQFYKKMELSAAFLHPKLAILELISPKIKRLRPLANLVRKPLLLRDPLSRENFLCYNNLVSMT